jgi:antitoxin YefM
MRQFDMHPYDGNKNQPILFPYLSINICLMELTYRLNANELNEDFINTIKKLYKGKDLEVTVQVKEDETEYLLKSEANREQLLKAVKDVKNKKNLRTLNMDKLNDLVK